MVISTQVCYLNFDDSKSPYNVIIDFDESVKSTEVRVYGDSKNETFNPALIKQGEKRKGMFTFLPDVPYETLKKGIKPGNLVYIKVPAGGEVPPILPVLDFSQATKSCKVVVTGKVRERNAEYVSNLGSVNLQSEETKYKSFLALFSNLIIECPDTEESRNTNAKFELVVDCPLTVGIDVKSCKGITVRSTRSGKYCMQDSHVADKARNLNMTRVMSLLTSRLKKQDGDELTKLLKQDRFVRSVENKLKELGIDYVVNSKNELDLNVKNANCLLLTSNKTLGSPRNLYLNSSEPWFVAGHIGDDHFDVIQTDKQNSDVENSSLFLERVAPKFASKQKTGLAKLITNDLDRLITDHANAPYNVKIFMSFLLSYIWFYHYIGNKSAGLAKAFEEMFERVRSVISIKSGKEELFKSELKQIFLRADLQSGSAKENDQRKELVSINEMERELQALTLDAKNSIKHNDSIFGRSLGVLNRDIKNTCKTPGPNFSMLASKLYGQAAKAA